MVLSEIKKEYAVLLKISAVSLMAVAVVTVLSSKMSQLVSMFSELTSYPELISVMIKGVIISVITTICADICTEGGNLSLAGTIRFAGRVMIFILSYPLIEAVIKTAISFAGG